MPFHLLKHIGFNEQQYIIIIGLIFTISFTLFFYKYSKNMFLSLYLHLTIGLFTMSMSGIKQTMGTVIIMYAFSFVVNEDKGIVNFIKYFIVLILAYFTHSSAIVFFPIYFLRNIKINKKNGSFLVVISSSLILIRKQIVPLISYLMPRAYDMKYEIITSQNPVNPLLILISILIPVVCLIFLNKNHDYEDEKYKLFSILFILSCINIMMNVLSLNSSILGRLSFYFTTFNMVLIPNIIVGIKNKKLRILAYYISIILPLIQFTITTPGGTLAIDKYRFFWQ